MPANLDILDPPLCSVIERVPVLRGATDVAVAPFMGGHSNVSYLVSADGARYMVRVASEAGRVLGIDRVQELAALERAVDAGIAPELIAFLLPEGHCVTSYLASARSFGFEEFTAEETIRRVALRMRDIHALEPIDRIFDPYGDVGRWLAITDQERVPRPTRLAALLERLDEAERRLTGRRRQPVLCHNDPYYLNFLDDGTLRVVDWEYAGMGDAMYDLAAIAARLDRDTRQVLLETYHGTADDLQWSDLAALIDVYLSWNVAWSLIQEVHSEIDFDYYAYAESLLDLAFRTGPPGAP